MLYSTLLAMEININCDLGEKSKHHSNKNDPNLLEIVNSANVACGYHACLLYTSPSPRDVEESRMPSSA